MGTFARAMDRLAEWVRWLAEAVRLLKPRQNPQNAQGVLEAFLSDVPVAERTEDELRADGVPVDDIKDTEEREHGAAEEAVPGEQAGDEGDAGSASGADNASASVDGVVEGTGETRAGGKEGAEQAQTDVVGEDVGGGAVRTETREERLERRARQRREREDILAQLGKKGRKYGGRRMSVEVPEAAYSAQKFSTEDVGNDILDVMDLLAQSKDATIQSNELGEVIYPFGRMGKRGMGFLHIIERRMAQGHTLDEAIEIAFRVGEAAARGSETIPENKNLRNKKWIDKNGYRAIVAIDSTQRPIITGYDIDDGETRNHSSARRRLEGYAPNPHVSSEEVVAALKRIITDIREERKDVKFSTEKPGDVGMSATVRSVREALRRDGDKAVELLGGTILSNYVREETDAALRKRVARAAVEKLLNVVPVSEERLRQAGLIEETLALPEDEDEVASEYEDAKIVDARNRLAHGGVLVGESQAEAVVRARAKQVLGKTFRYLFEVYHGTPHAGWTRWERGHGGTTGLGYAYFAPRVITAAEYADTSDTPNKGLADVKDMQRYGLSEAVYHMVVGMNNPLIVDCRRASWNNIRMRNKRTVRTDEILNVARFGELGYDGVIFLNVHDSQLSVKLHGYDVDVDLTEVTVTTRSRAKENPPTIPLSAAVEQVAIHQGAGYSPSTEDTIAQNLPGVKFSTEKPGDAKLHNVMNRGEARPLGRPPGGVPEGRKKSAALLR